MPRKKADINWSDVKARLRSCAETDLLELVHELFKLSAENRAFLASRLLGPSAGRALLGPYRQRIGRAFYKRGGRPQEKLQLAVVRKLIRDYEAATSDPAGSLELMLTCLEIGTQFAREFGDNDQSFYSSLCSVLYETKKVLDAEEGRELYDAYRPRLRELAEFASPIAWGFGDEVQSTVAEIESWYDEA